MKTHSLKVQRTAHYYTLGTANDAIEELWIVCHGYGQLASEIIHKFSNFNDGKHLIVSCEGLSRFYWGGVQGKVAASWMTSKDRLDEIEDFTEMMQSIYEHFVKELSQDVKITLFGFSQGVATHFRWILAKQPRFDRLIMWGGVLPDDLDYLPYQSYFSDKEINFHCGKQDQYLTEEKVDWHRKFIDKNKLDIKEYWFEGIHKVERSHLEEVYLK